MAAAPPTQVMAAPRHVSSIPEAAVTTITAETGPFRLPTTAVPSHYTLTLHPEFNTFSFTGILNVNLDIKQSISELWMNSIELQFSRVSFKSDDGHHPVFYAQQLDFYPTSETVRVRFSNPIPAGPGVLQVTHFKGTLNDNMKGFYRSKYTAAGGEQRYMACTQFESTDARRAFPCWDEPAYKATFSVHMIAPKDRMVLSNMPELSATELAALSASGMPIPDGWKRFSFQKSPVMSTYLLAFIVGEGEHIEGKTKTGVTVRVFTPLGKKNMADFTLEVAVKSLDFFADYFQIPFPLPKMDLIGIPDFAMGAMENWGLVTYRENLVLANKGASSSQLQQIAITVSHENAHQWFGNYVTMKWWKDLWLNEGFATFISYLFVENAYPAWSPWKLFVDHSLAAALSLDSLLSSHPIEVEVQKASEINEIFDRISYEKGSAVIRMCEDFVGRTTFRDGLRIYLKRHAWKNASTSDLWQALGEASGKDVTGVMGCFTRQMGFPLITVEPAGGSKLKVRQDWFIADGSAPPADKPNQLWSVPLTYQLQDGSTGSYLLTTKEGTIDIKGGANNLLKFNPGQKGFYRVNYTQDQWRTLATAMQSGQLKDAADRTFLISDAYALAVAGKLPLLQTMSLMPTRASKEEELIVYSQMSSLFGSLEHLLLDAPDRLQEALRQFRLESFSHPYERWGWDISHGDHSRIQLQALCLRQLVSARHPKVVREAEALFEKGLVGNVPEEFHSHALYATVLYGGRPGFEAVRSLYRQPNISPQLKTNALRELGAVRDPVLHDELMLWITTKDGEVRISDVIRPLANVPLELRRVLWRFVRDSWQGMIQPRWGETPNLLAYFVNVPGSGFTRTDEIDDLKRFFEANPTPAVARVIQQTIESMRTKLQFEAREKASVNSWLLQHYPPSH